MNANFAIIHLPFISPLSNQLNFLEALKMGKSPLGPLCLALCLFAVFGPGSFADAAQRTALVIGNSHYTHAPLRNPANDAEDMAAILTRLGFRVTLETNAGRKTMQRAINTFGKQLRSGGVGLFYYAGHGLQVQGRNYLIPIGAMIESESDVEFEAVDAGRVLGKMEDAGNSLNIVILDACRNNPFARSFRSNTRGLAKMDAPRGSILAYSTAPGSVAADGTGRNGLYTAKLLKHMSTPGIKIEAVFKKVRIDVSRASSAKQTPWESSSLMGDFYFHPLSATVDSSSMRAINVKARPTTGQLDAEAEMWAIVKTSKSIEDYQVFMEEFPNGAFKGAARLKIQQLKRKQNARPMMASIAPAVKQTTLPRPKRVDPNALRVALFPPKIFTDYGVPSRFYDGLVRTVNTLMSEDDRLVLQQSFYGIEELPDSVHIFSDFAAKAENRVWKKKSPFSPNLPDEEQLRKIGRKIDADLAVLVLLKHGAGAKVDIHIHDFRQGKTYSRVNKLISYNNVNGGIEQNTREVIKDFFNNQ